MTETWNEPKNVQLCNIEGYNGHHIYRQRINRGGGVGGGVSLFICDSLSGEMVLELSYSSETIEICTCCIEIDRKNILLIGIYRPFSDTVQNFTNVLEGILNHPIVKNAALVLLAGDLNIDVCDSGPAVSEAYLTLMQSHNFLPTIVRPTRIIYNENNEMISCSNLDHIWINKIDPYLSGILLFDAVDHMPTFLKFHFKTKPLTNEKICIKTRPFSESNQNSLIADLENSDWDSILWDNLNEHDVNLACYNFLTHLNKLYCKNFPTKVKFLSQKRLCNTWLKSDLKKLINKKSQNLKLLRLGLITKEVNNAAKNEVYYATRRAKQNYYKNAFQQAARNMRKKWSLLRKLLGSDSKQQKITKIVIDDIEYSDPSVIADQFNEYFCSVADNLASELSPPSGNSPCNISRRENSFFLFDATVPEINKIISHLKITKTDLDTIPVKIFKQVSHIISPIVCILINISFMVGKFPDCLKLARVTPIYKKGVKTELGNYRPISSLPFLSKVFERAMANRLVKYLNKYSIIHHSQFGFQKGKSTSDAIHYLTEFIYEQLHLKNSVVNVLIDLRKAFDTVDHELLLYKLSLYGIRGVPLLWMESYLSDRKQYVSIESYSSVHKTIKIGVPQGSILGPILFLIFINDLPLSSETLKTTLFADDTTLSLAHSNYDELVPTINRELSAIHRWTIDNKLTVNVEKTELMLFTNSTSVNYSNNDIALGGEYLKFTDCSMFLGVKLDCGLKFSNHISYISDKISKNIGIFSKIKDNLPLEARKSYYYSFVYPFITYNVISWGHTYSCHLEPIVLLQKRMIRYMTDSSYLAHTNELFYQLGILKFEDVYKYFTCIYMQKALKEGKYRTQHSLNTRNRNLAQSVFHRLTMGQQSLSFMGPKTWNGLPENVRCIDNLSSFKYSLKQYLLRQYAPH